MSMGWRQKNSKNYNDLNWRDQLGQSSPQCSLIRNGIVTAYIVLFHYLILVFGGCNKIEPFQEIVGEMILI